MALLAGAALAVSRLIIGSGLVEKPEEYLYSSAKNYYGMSGLIDIIQIEPLVV